MTPLELLEHETIKNNEMVMFLNTQINTLATLKAQGLITGLAYAKLHAPLAKKRNELTRLNGDCAISIGIIKMNELAGKTV